MSDDLRARVERARPGSGERARVIVNVDGGSVAQTSLALENAGAAVRGQLQHVGAVVADVPVDRLSELAGRGDVSWISADQPVHSLAVPDNTSHAEVTTGASKFLPDGNEKMADGGAGNKVGIAILDSGISPPDAAEFVGYEWRYSSGTLGTGLFSQKYLASYDRIKKRVDFTGEAKSQDAYGHGTHTAGVAAGTGQASENYAAQHAGAPTYGGIAPGAHLVDVRVLNSQGTGTVSNVISGINWVIQNRKSYNIRVMNLSLGTAVTQSYETDPLCQAVGRAVDAGIVVVVAAGNWGKDAEGRPIYGGILSPANSPKVITVGATNTQQTDARSDDIVTTYSSRGPTLVDGIAKPDLVAPGNRIGAAETAVSSPTASYSYSSTGGGGLLGGLISGDTSSNTPKATGTYEILSGTSFAAPAVAGSVALMLEANPSLTPSIVKAALMRTAQRLPFYETAMMTGQMSQLERVVTEGAGELNASAAVALARAIRKDANRAEVGDNLLTGKNQSYQSLGLTSPIAGEQMPLNNGLVWVAGVAFTDRLKLTNGFRLPDGRIVSDGFVLVNGHLLTDGTYLFADGKMVPGGYTLGSGIVMSDGYTLGSGIVMSDGYTLGSGIVMSDGYTLGSGIVMSDGYTLGSGIVMSDGVPSSRARASLCFENEGVWASNMVDPASMQMDEEQVMIQGEEAMPIYVGRLSPTSPLYPRR
jgi:subtilisin family serine protease